MEFFYEEVSINHKNGGCSAFYLKDDKRFYAGRHLYVDDKKITYYIMPLKEHEAIIFLYIGDDTFDEFCNEINDNTEEAFTKTWPMLIQALKDGINDNYYKCALIKLPKVHEDGWFWCFATRVENIDYKNMESDYVMGKVEKLVEQAVNIFVEVDENDISTWQRAKTIGKSGWRSYSTAHGILRGIGTAASVIGAFFGFDFSGE